MRRLYWALLAAPLFAGTVRAEEPSAPPATPAPVSDARPAMKDPPTGSLADCIPDCKQDVRTSCCECPRAWWHTDALLWWGQGMRTPPLVTQGGNPPAVRFGGSRLNDEMRAGARTEFGVWFDDCHFALQGSYFFLAPARSLDQFGSGLPAQPTGRPFINANTGQLAFELVPGFVTGSASTTGVTGADALVRVPVCCGTGCDTSYRVDVLAGYRYFGLNDQLAVRENLSPGAPFVPGTQITVFDSFRTENRFHGASLGAAFVGRRGGVQRGVDDAPRPRRHEP
ncbi:BBP7 family outer membrane beta-barrel protein [Gemmata palustris]|nr:BBP7 family outer membrane beta-barrel protein [Gemmata palustris]